MIRRLQLLLLLTLQCVIINNIKYYLLLNYICNEEIFDICNETKKI